MTYLAAMLTAVAVYFALLCAWAALSRLADRLRAKDCPRCAPTRARLQRHDPIGAAGLTEREFLDKCQASDAAAAGSDYQGRRG